jgi:hypothetical protein
MKRIWIILLLIPLAACLPFSAPSPVPTASQTIIPTSSPTVEWFPPTSTPEISPTVEVSPTPQLMAELGDVIFKDDFESGEGWTVPQSERGEINIANGEINIIINEPGSFFIGTLEKPDLQDFYAEISASAILCSPRDEYGFLFRVLGRNQYYRFALTCDGQVRLDSISGETGTILYPWTRSASVPVGAPSISTLAVLAMDDQIHVFINGDPQFSVRVQQQAGSFGVFARSVGDTAVTISFSDFIVREVLPKE